MMLKRRRAITTKVKRKAKKSRLEESSQVAEHVSEVQLDLEPPPPGCPSDEPSGVSSGGEEEEEEEMEEGGAERKRGDQGLAIANDTGSTAAASKAGLYAPPTHDELQMLKETETLYKSNLMRMQITELLLEVKPKKKITGVSSSRLSRIDEWLHSLKATVAALPSSKSVDLSEAASLLSKTVRCPLNFDPTNLKGKFQFVAPKVVKVVGSYLLGTTVKPDLNIDLAMYIPQECLQAKDILNYRYFYKRLLYLAMVAGYLGKKKKSLSLESLEFYLPNGDPLRPVVLLRLKGKGLSKYSIQLHTAIPEAFFKHSRLGPDRNNVRRNFFVSGEQGKDVAKQDNKAKPSSSSSPPPLSSSPPPPPPPPTPHYNAALLSEMGAQERHLHLLHASMEGRPAMADAVVLCKVWAKQRELDKGGCGKLGGFLFSMLVAHLLQQNKINHLMSSYQIFRIVLQHLATTDWCSKGVVMATAEPNAPHVDLFHSSFDVVFVDSSGYLNLCADMSAVQFALIQHEALLSMDFLDDPTTNGFDALFMRRLSFVEQFDLVCHLPSKSLSLASMNDPVAREAIQLDRFAWPFPLLLKFVVWKVLRRGLGKRVKLIATRLHYQQKWSTSKPPPDLSSECKVSIGLLLDAELSLDILDMGPPADSKLEASQFRSFWGEKSELRRFQDGSINEAVVWEGRSLAEKRTICLQVAKHLLERHAHIPPSSISCNTLALEDLLSQPDCYHASSILLAHEQDDDSSPPPLPPCTGEEESHKVIKVFTELGKQIRQLRDIPLAVTSIQGTSPVFRHAEVYPPVPWSGKLSSSLRAAPMKNSQPNCFYPSCDVATPPYVHGLNVVCQLEASGKWPDQLPGIRAIKTAFYLHLSRALCEQHRGGVLASPTANYLDILKDGYVFRLRIHYPRELALMKEEMAPAASSSSQPLHPEGPEASLGVWEGVGKERVRRVEEEEVMLPLHTSTINGLHQQYPSSFGAGVRLCKRWVCAQLLSSHLSEEAVELVAAHLYLRPAPYTHPCSPSAVFLRFLDLLSSHEWSARPLVVDLTQELTVSDVSEITEKFNTNRSHKPAMFVATPQDRFSSCWTRPNPIPPVLARIQVLARESRALLLSQLECCDLSSVDLRQVFRPPLCAYNVLIHLHKRHTVLSGQSVDATTTTTTGARAGVTGAAAAAVPSGDIKEDPPPPPPPPPRSCSWLHYHQRRKYRHLPIVGFNPVEEYLRELEAAYSDFALFFHDKFGGSFIAVVWKPSVSVPHTFKVGQAHCRTTSSVKNKENLAVDVDAIVSDFAVMGEGLVKSVEVL